MGANAERDGLRFEDDDPLEILYREIKANSYIEFTPEDSPQVKLLFDFLAALQKLKGISSVVLPAGPEDAAYAMLYRFGDEIELSFEFPIELRTQIKDLAKQWLPTIPGWEKEEMFKIMRKKRGDGTRYNFSAKFAVIQT